ncbi:MAG: hypothetical protein F6K35_47730, partial [Okeania sp. SIO2H7]|nr:hypothetical protein [Okeania sp. SIO2H7]
MKIISKDPLVRLKNRSNSSKNIIKRVLTGDVTQRCSRFYWFRQGYSLVQKTTQKFDKNIQDEILKFSSKSSLFDGFSVENGVKEIRRTGVAFGLQLAPEMTQTIYEYAVNNFCFEPGYIDHFKINQIEKGWLKNERRVFRGLLWDLGNCQAIEKITKDPVLLKIVSSYLGYYPTLITQHLTWSIASNLPAEEVQKNYPATNFHYDIAGYNFMTCYFYITDVDVSSGPHVMIANSHLKKPLSMLLTSGRHSD